MDNNAYYKNYWNQAGKGTGYFDEYGYGSLLAWQISRFASDGELTDSDWQNLENMTVREAQQALDKQGVEEENLHWTVPGHPGETTTYQAYPSKEYSAQLVTRSEIKVLKQALFKDWAILENEVSESLYKKLGYRDQNFEAAILARWGQSFPKPSYSLSAAVTALTGLDLMDALKKLENGDEQITEEINNIGVSSKLKLENIWDAYFVLFRNPNAPIKTRIFLMNYLSSSRLSLALPRPYTYYTSNERLDTLENEKLEMVFDRTVPVEIRVAAFESLLRYDSENLAQRLLTFEAVMMLEPKGYPYEIKKNGETYLGVESGTKEGLRYTELPAEIHNQILSLYEDLAENSNLIPISNQNIDDWATLDSVFSSQYPGIHGSTKLPGLKSVCYDGQNGVSLESCLGSLNAQDFHKNVLNKYLAFVAKKYPGTELATRAVELQSVAQLTTVDEALPGQSADELLDTFPLYGIEPKPE